MVDDTHGKNHRERTQPRGGDVAEWLVIVVPCVKLEITSPSSVFWKLDAAQLEEGANNLNRLDLSFED
jgi:hypothetical protein